MALVLAGMIVLLEFDQGGKRCMGVTIYAVALYTFYKIIKSMIQLFKERKETSPLMMILRRINYLDACVSVLTLQTAMLHAFSKEGGQFVKVMNGLTGSGVCLISFGMGIQGMLYAKKMIKKGRNVG